MSHDEETPDDEISEAIVLRLRANWLTDSSKGQPRPLAEYLELFPRKHWDLVLNELCNLRGDTEDHTAISTAELATGITSKDARFGPYRLLQELGRGGQGTVYLAEDTRLQRRVALKVLANRRPGAPETLLRFRREAEVASKLNHPGLCTVYEAGTHHNSPFIAMELVPGKTLAQWVATARQQREQNETSCLTLPTSTNADQGWKENGDTSGSTRRPRRQAVDQTLAFVEKVARALHTAHEAGVLHRDVKPSNIIVTSNGEPVLMDFGLAREESSDLPTLTGSGDVFGTPAYMSPEQLSRKFEPLDHRTDVWSLGVTLYECLTLKRPFESVNREEVYEAILAQDPPDARQLNPAIPRDLKIVIDKSLEKEPDRRYPTALAFAEDLRRVRELQLIEARPVSAMGRLWRWARRRPARAALAASLLLGVPTVTWLAGYVLANQPIIEEQRNTRIAEAVEDHLERGYYELHHGDPEVARRQFEAAVRADRTSAEAAGGLVLVQLQRQRPKAARDLLQAHRKVFDDDAIRDRLQVRILELLDQPAEAEALRARLRPPSTAPGHFLAGMQTLIVAHQRDSRMLGGSTVAPIPGRPAGRLYEVALKSLRKAVLLAPRARRTYHLQVAHAIGHLRGAVDPEPIATAIAALWPEDSAALDWCAFAWRHTDRKRATAAYRQIIRLAKQRAARAVPPFMLGTALREVGRPKEAAAAFRQVIALNPENAKAHFNLGILYHFFLRDLDAAIAAYQQAVKLAPEQSQHHNNLGLALQDQGRLKEAVDAYRQTILASPEFPYGYYGLGNALMAQRRFDEAIQEYDKAIQISPEYAEAHLNRANCLKQQGRFREALPGFRTGHALGSRRQNWRYRSDKWVADCSQLVELQTALEDGISAVPREDLGTFIMLTQRQDLHDLTCRLWQELIARDPERAHNRLRGYGFRAARDAAIAITKHDVRRDDGSSDRASLARRALVWLRGDLAALKKGAETGSMQPAEVRQTLAAWRSSQELSPLRATASLKKLPDPKAWSKLWSEVDAILNSR